MSVERYEFNRGLPCWCDCISAMAIGDEKKYLAVYMLLYTVLVPRPTLFISVS